MTPPFDGRRPAVALAVALLGGVGLQAAYNAARHSATPLEPAQAAFLLDPNTATVAELTLLPGVGPRIAESIVQERASRPAPAFRRLEDLDDVPRIGPATLDRLRPYLRFPEPDEDS